MRLNHRRDGLRLHEGHIAPDQKHVLGRNKGLRFGKPQHSLAHALRLGLADEMSCKICLLETFPDRPFSARTDDDCRARIIGPQHAAHPQKDRLSLDKE